MIRMDFLIGMNMRQAHRKIIPVPLLGLILDWLLIGNLMRLTALLFTIHPVMMSMGPWLDLMMDGVPVVPEVPLDLTVLMIMSPLKG